MNTKWKVIGVTATVMLALFVTAGVALAFTASKFISFTLEGCRNDGTITLPIGGKFICPDAAYTTGNLGKGWNELDLVPHRLTTTAGNQAGVTSDYNVIIAADYQTSGRLGYDVISVPVVNSAKSDASCTVSAGPQQTQSGVVGGTDVVVFRQLTIHQNAGTTCVFDYYQRLALGSHLYPGSSLQSYMFEDVAFSTGKKTLSIPVNQILPQSLGKDMTATQGTDHVWDVTKGATPATLSFGNTCDATQPTSQGVQLKVSWTKGPADPSGPITVITHVYATNPSARTITTNVTDQIFSGTTLLDTSPTATVNVPANTANLLVLTHTFPAPSGTTNLNDTATATYTDLVTGVPIPGNTTATASAAVQLTGPELNASATINDSESITGSGLTFSADSFSPAIGAFDGGYVEGTQTVGPLSWTTSPAQTGSSSVTFNKTVYVAGPSQETGSLSDTATLTGSDGASDSASASVNISTDARVSLTINKTVDPALTSGSQSFTFHVKNSSNVEVATPTITFNAGDPSTNSATVGNLAPDSYTVSEDQVTDWVTGDPQTVTISLPSCSGSVSFSNLHRFSPTISTTPNPSTATVGDMINDSATVSGGYQPTGTVTFNLYSPSDATCSGTPANIQTVALSGLSASTSPGFATTTVGTYHWIATYNGDKYNNTATSGCLDEAVTVEKAQPAIKTTAVTPVTVGETIHDTATISGLVNPTGAAEITFTLYSDASCTTQVFTADSGAVTVNGSYQSPDYTPVNAGDYYWVASFPGDANNKAAATKCGDAGETSVVNPAQPAIKTTAVTPVTVGETIHDTATISGLVNPTGAAKITFTLYSDKACTNQVFTGDSGAVTVNGSYQSPDYTPVNAGDYYWIASFPGDANNKSASTSCGDAGETSVVNPAQPAIKTTAITPVTVGETIHDTATISGLVNPTGAANITFTLYSDASCTTSVFTADSGAVTADGDYASGDYTPANAGSYYWVASFPGDANNKAAATKCGDAGETSVVNPAQPAIKTTAVTPVTVGDTIHDTATISGLVNPTGAAKITFTLYSDKACTNQVFTGDSALVTVNGSYQSPDYTPANAGSYYWIASFPGDANNKAAATKCGDADETSVVNPFSPSIQTIASNNSGDSTTVTDSATLSGGYYPTGSITFYLYGPSATASCTSANLVFTSSPVTVSGNGTYGPVSFSPTSVGSYYWIASYSGDTNNNPVSGACGATGETSIVRPGLAKVIKTVNGAVPTGTQAFTFQLRFGASTTSEGIILQQEDASSANNWTINFTDQLVPGRHYQLCEWVLPGWNTSLGPNLFVPNSIIPPALPNPNVNNMTICTDFVAQANQTATFTVDNTPPPGGRALTIGFWKNWSSCANSSGKGQKPILDQTLATATGMTTNPPGGLVVSAQNPGGGWPNFAAKYFLVLKGDLLNPDVAPDCSIAVSLLNKSTTGGKKMASDPLFNMAAQLVGAQLNYFAGAGKNGPTTLNIQRAVLLLGKYGFNGNPYSPKLSKADVTLANCLATQLDNYNNDRTVSTCP